MQRYFFFFFLFFKISSLHDLGKKPGGVASASAARCRRHGFGQVAAAMPAAAQHSAGGTHGAWAPLPAQQKPRAFPGSNRPAGPPRRRTFPWPPPPPPPLPGRHGVGGGSGEPRWEVTAVRGEAAAANVTKASLEGSPR